MLTKEVSDRNPSLEVQKAWSQNFGHKNLDTTLSAYMHVSVERQGDLIKGLANEA